MQISGPPTQPTSANIPAKRRHLAASALERLLRRDLPEADIEMLAGIRFRGEEPRTPERWEFIYQAIKNSAPMDRQGRESRAPVSDGAFMTL